MTDLSSLYLYVTEKCSDPEILAFLSKGYEDRLQMREALAGIREESRSPMQSNERVG